MPERATFTSTDGVEIVYWAWGEPVASPPVLLHHGFVAHARANWEAPGVVEELVRAGRRVIAPDARGHGESDKPHDPSSYGEQRMARDLAALVDRLAVAEIDLVGYSMGAVVSLLFAAEDERVRRLVVGGVGSGIIECGGVDRRALSNESIIEALSVEDPQGLEQEGARAFRTLADALGSDREAMVAQASSIYRGEIALGRIAAPTLVLAGEADPLAIRPQVLAQALPNASLQLLEGDHMRALIDPRFASSIVSFLA
ncbi:MAG TPA: alpha/beta hydrolase [Solirubrobacteraceae bacterium]|jgi:pimeloyl-ACP methyl ester carboxylesterase